MDALKSLVQPLVGNVAGNSVVDGMKLVVLGGTVETARRMSSSAWQVTSPPTPVSFLAHRPSHARSSFVNSFFLTAHFSEEDYPYEWLMLWLSRRPEWQRSREFETTTNSSSPGFYGYRESDSAFSEEERVDEEFTGKSRMRVVFQPTSDTTHTIFYRGHWLRVRRGRKSNGYEMLSISVVARNNSILKQLVLQAKKEYEAEAVHRIQIYFADSYGSWRYTDSRHKRPLSSIVLNPGVKEMLVADAKDFLKSEKWYADRGIPFRRGYLLYGVPGSGKSSLIHALAGELTLDIYVVSLSSSWINDSTLTTLMGRVPSRCIVLLEDLDAAFTRSVSRSKDKDKDKDKKKSDSKSDNEEESTSSSSGRSRRNRNKENLSDVNTLTLSGLLNALDGVAAAEGRILFATTNHLDQLDPALCRPGRMDVWIEFKNASKFQAEHLFRNFFPSSDAEAAAAANIELETELESLEMPAPSSPATSQLSSLFSEALSGLSSASSRSGSLSPLSSPTPVGSHSRSRRSESVSSRAGAKSEASELSSAVEEHVAACAHAAPPLSAARLAQLAKQFADSIPDEGFSVAALQGCECPFFFLSFWMWLVALLPFYGISLRSG
ncbi:P-loop containing nucleoside triphosphate hydrolase protein [Lactarius sanguifluus]|nr:P-loop containing nucleoside triphosphate hydrolase protein [Lactarius sanguifluus]